MALHEHELTFPILLFLFSSFPFLLHKISFQFVRSYTSYWTRQSWWSNRGSSLRLSGHQDECGENPASVISVSVLHLSGGEREEVPGNRHHPPQEENYQEGLHWYLTVWEWHSDTVRQWHSTTALYNYWKPEHKLPVILHCPNTPRHFIFFVKIIQSLYNFLYLVQYNILYFKFKTLFVSLL